MRPSLVKRTNIMKKIMLRSFIFAAILIVLPSALRAQDQGGATMSVNLENIFRLDNVESRSISAENFTGEKGKAGMATTGDGAHASRELGQGWKVSPSIEIKAKSTFTLADITGPGCIRSIWFTPTGNWRLSVLRLYWDD